MVRRQIRIAEVIRYQYKDLFILYFVDSGYHGIADGILVNVLKFIQ